MILIFLLEMPCRGSDPAKAGFDVRGIIQVHTAADVASVMERIQGEQGVRQPTGNYTPREKIM
jgi:hypothetical protein